MTSSDSKAVFVLGMRIFFGIWLLYAGVTKWLLMGPNAFVGFITTEFDKTWSPHALNVFLAWFIIIAEPVFALWLLSGIKPRVAWLANAALMFLLTIGQTILMKPEVTDNWHYVVLTLACAALASPNEAKRQP